MENHDEIQIKRERIIQNMTEHKSNTVILSAPPCFGKKVAVREYIKEQKFKNSIWLNIENKDEEYIWKDFCKNITSFKSTMVKKIKGMVMPNDHKKIDGVVDLLKTELKKRFCIVFDGFSMQNKSTSLVHFLDKFMNENIDNITIIVITNDNVNDDFLRMYIQGKCNIIDHEVLSFNSTEIKEYMSENGLQVDKNTAKEIHRLTGGWLFLLKLIKQEYNFSSDGRFFPVAQEYSKRILFDRKSHKEKEAILRLAVLDEFEIDQAKYTVGLNYMDNLIEDILNGNTMFFKNSETSTYSMYPLIRNALNGAIILNGIDKREIIRKSALWYELQQNYLKSIQLYMKAEDRENTLRILGKIKLIKNKAVLIIMKKAFDFLKEDKYILKEKYLSFMLLYALVIDVTDGVKMYNEAEQYYNEKENLQQNGTFAGMINFTGGIMNFNDVEKMLPLMRTAYENLGGRILKNDEVEFLFGVHSPLFVFYRSPGTLKQILNMSKECIKYYSSVSLGHDVGTDFLLDADYSLLVGDYSKSEDEAKRALFKARLEKNYDVILCADFILLRQYMLLKNESDCDKIIKEMEMIRKKNVINTSTIDVMLGYYYACVGNIQKIPEWILTANMDECKLPNNLRETAYVAIAVAMIAQKKFLELEVFAMMIRDTYQKKEHYELGTIYSYIFLAVAKLNNREKNEALMLLDIAINSSEFDNIVEPFIELATPILPLLEEISKKNRFAKNILGNCKASKNILESKKDTGYNFTERERQVIECMLDGYKQTEIAKHLYISLPTVKKHVQNIYKKLCISSKSEAIKILKSHFKN